MKILIKYSFIILLLTGFVIILHSCKKEELPTLSTSTITNITATAASGGGNITSDGGTEIIARGVCWGISANPATSGLRTNDGTGDGQFTSNLTGLTAGTTYHIRAYAANSVGTAYGDDITFLTLGKVPEALTQPATNITSSGATLNGTVNANDLSTSVTFEFGLTTSYGQSLTATQSPVTGNNITNVSVDITGLTAGTTYHFRIKTVNSLGTAYGGDMELTPIGQVPTSITQDATNILTITATLNGTVNPNYLPTTVTFEYGTSASYGQTIPAIQSPITGNNIVSVSADLTGLLPGTTYHFRVKSVNTVGTTYGGDLTFPTLGQAPIATTLDATNKSTIGATLNGTVNPNYLSTTVTFEYGISTSYGQTIIASQSPVTGNSITNVSADISGLNPGITYHYRVKAINSKGTTTGNDMSFTTSGQVPSVTTLDATNKSTTGATLNGAVNANNLSTTVTFEYGITTSYGQTATAAQNPVTGNSITNVTAEITGLTAGTIYHFRVKAVNTIGIKYGSDLTFTTVPTIPTLSTNSASHLTTNSAFTGGNITSDGGASITSKGVCWSTSHNPTIADSYTSNEGGTDRFSSHINGLQNNINYFVRAYATNSVGTAYGNEITFTLWLAYPGSQITDLNGNSYNTVMIGTQVWMAENLKTTYYNDGIPIPLVEDAYEWVALTTAAYYRGFYNGYAVNTDKLCPLGWHVPSDDEWKMLEMYIGMTQEQIDSVGHRGTNQALQLKDSICWPCYTRLECVTHPNQGGTNSSGFSAKASGVRIYTDGRIQYEGNPAPWWTSSDENTRSAYFRGLMGWPNEIDRGAISKNFGLGVRCIKD